MLSWSDATELSHVSLPIQTAHGMLDAATRFVAAFGPGERDRLVLPFEGEERLNWDYRPRPDRRGVALKDMQSGQQKFAFALLASGLGARSIAQVLGIMGLETVLEKLEEGRGRHIRDPDRYYFTVFGTPSEVSPWGWRVEGHHVSLNFLILEGLEIATTPNFLGANPAHVRTGPHAGMRLLVEEEDLARDLYRGLDPVRRAAALISPEAPSDIITGWERRIHPDSPLGISANELDDTQREQLMHLVAVYTSRMPKDLADYRLNRIFKEGVGTIHFAWAGSGEPGRGHYYRLQGPSFFVEYDNTQNDANHIHSVWREVGGDWGDDLLRAHYLRSHGPSEDPASGPVGG